MKIHKIELFEVNFPFRFTFRHASQTRSGSHALLIRVTTDRGIEGWGETHPRPYLTGETIASCRTYCKDQIVAQLSGLEFSLQTPPWIAMNEAYRAADRHRALAIWAGIDLAVTDAWSRTFNQPIGPLLYESIHSVDACSPKASAGVAETPAGSATCEITAPIGLAPLPLQLVLVLAFRAAGYRHFKVKIADRSHVRNLLAIKKAMGSAAHLRVDVNGIWNFREAAALLPQLEKAGVKVLEQPLPAGKVQEMASLQKMTSMDLMADESYCSLQDAEDLAAAEACRMWNFRLGKNGGFTGWHQHKKLAAANNIRLQIGTLVGELGPLPAASALIREPSACSYFEYGFPEVLIADSPFPKGTTARCSLNRSHENLGVASPPNMKAVQKHQQAIDSLIVSTR